MNFSIFPPKKKRFPTHVSFRKFFFYVQTKNPIRLHLIQSCENTKLQFKDVFSFQILQKTSKLNNLQNDRQFKNQVWFSTTFSNFNFEREKNRKKTKTGHIETQIWIDCIGNSKLISRYSFDSIEFNFFESNFKQFFCITFD